MTDLAMPYFMTNSEWYEEIEDEEGEVTYKLKPGVPPKAKDSFEKYMKELEEVE